MARLMIVLSREEVEEFIPYRLVCETMDGSVWNTFRRRREWSVQFTESERASCRRLYSLAHRWYLKSGVPDEVTMSMNTYDLWQRLGRFCGEL